MDWYRTRIAKEFPNKKWNYRSIISYKKTINQELTKVSVKPHISLACHGAAYSECWRGVEKAFSSCGKAEWRTYSAHFLL